MDTEEYYRIFSGKARVDPLHVWSYRDTIWIQSMG